MSNYRVYLTWDDGENTVDWVDANSAEHACFLIGVKFEKAGVPAACIVKVAAVLETN